MACTALVGDDVYVNMPRMYYFLAGHASKDEHPVIFAHVLSNTEVYDFDMPCLDSATVLSRSALELLSEHASCKTRAGGRVGIAGQPFEADSRHATSIYMIYYAYLVLFRGKKLLILGVNHTSTQHVPYRNPHLKSRSQEVVES